VKVVDLAYVVLLGAGLGLASAHLAVASRPVVGRVQIGPWDAWPRAGGRDIDPYLRAHQARGVHLPLGNGEGLELVAQRDDDGQRLDGRCRYLVAGATPTARGWTLSVTDGAGNPFRLPLDRVGFSHAEIARDEGGALRIAASSAPQAGNWLPLPSSGPFDLRLRLYDTPISSHAGELRRDILPTIRRIDCP
jgi:hypothetical protein